MVAAMPEIKRGERISEWSAEREALARIEDALHAILATLRGVNGLKPTFKPAQRPVTAVDRAKRRHKRAEHERLKAMLLPETPTDT